MVEVGEAVGGAIVDEGSDGVRVALEDIEDDPTMATGAVDVDGEHGGEWGVGSRQWGGLRELLTERKT
jgi:hypothetical protein